MDQYLSFSINSELYLIDITRIHGIIMKNADDITPVPNTPPFFIGLIQTNKHIISIISTSTILSNTPLIKKEKYNVIVIKDKPYGIIIDVVYSIIDASSEKLTTKPVTELNPCVINIYNSGDDIYSIIDVDKLIGIKSE